MSVKYIVSEKGNPSKPDERKKFYATAKADGKITFRKLSKEIANSLTFLSDTEVMAVLNKLTEVFRIYLKQGYIVSLDEFGSFQVGLLSEGTDTAESFNSSHIKSAKVNFRPSIELKKLTNSFTYEKH